MPQLKRDEKQALIEAAFDHVHADVAELTKQVAAEHAIVNMGQDITDFVAYASQKPESILYSCYRSFYQQSESDEMADGTEQEYRSWLKTAARDIKKVQKKGLPLTVRNVREAFLLKGPFAKK